MWRRASAIRIRHPRPRGCATPPRLPRRGPFRGESAALAGVVAGPLPPPPYTRRGWRPPGPPLRVSFPPPPPPPPPTLLAQKYGFWPPKSPPPLPWGSPPGV